MSIRFLSLFAGIGGFDLGLERSGWECAGQVEIDPFCQKVLAKHWPNVWRYGDVRGVTAELVREHCGRIDAIVGGFPCQDISVAGSGAGLDGKRSGLWSEIYRLVCEARPKFVLVENVSALLGRGMGRVLSDLAACGYDAEWRVFSACEFGAPHTRERLFILAYPHSERRSRYFNFKYEVPCGHAHWKAAPHSSLWRDIQRWLKSLIQDGNGILADAELLRMDDGVPERLDRNHALGNAIVPQVAEVIGRAILASMEDK